MSKADGLATAVPLFAALGDETRLQIVLRLADGGPASITELSGRFAVTRQAITKHLRVLAQAGLVRMQRRGRNQICTFEQQRLADARQYLAEISQQWDDNLTRLQHHLD